MINGVRDDVFPYTLWFPQRYDLQERFPMDNGVRAANLVIAACVSHAPERRPSHAELVTSLTGLGDGRAREFVLGRLDVMVHEEQQAIHLEEASRIGGIVAGVFEREWDDAVQAFVTEYPGSTLATTLGAARLQRVPAAVDTAVRRGTDSPLFNPVRGDSLHAVARMQRGDTTHGGWPWVRLAVSIAGHAQRRTWVLSLYQGECGLMQEVFRPPENVPSVHPYEAGVVQRLLYEAVAYLTGQD